MLLLGRVIWLVWGVVWGAAIQPAEDIIGTDREPIHGTKYLVPRKSKGGARAGNVLVVVVVRGVVVGVLWSGSVGTLRSVLSLRSILAWGSSILSLS